MNWLKEFLKNNLTTLPGEAAWHNFTPRAQKALVLAREEAARLNHNYVGTEHLLLGLVGLRDQGSFWAEWGLISKPFAR